MNEVAGQLHFGFDPKCDQIGLECIGGFEKWANKRPQDREYELGQAINVLEDAFEKAWNEVHESDRHVVPLSGGLDSRAVLAGLLDYADPDTIQTVTFGMPGCWDFEFGRRVADACGVNHVSVKVTDIDWSIDALEKTAYRTGIFGQLFSLNIHRQSVYDRFPDGTVYWDGYMGDPLAGSHLPDNPPEDWDKAREWFTEMSAEIDPEFRNSSAALSLLPEEPFLSRSLLPYDEQIDYGIRQQCFIRPKPTDSHVVCPFLKGDWPGFILHLPRDWRQERRFFNSMVQIWKPELFKEIPTTAANGLPLSVSEWRKELRRYTVFAGHRVRKMANPDTVHPHRTTWDWNNAFRKAKYLRGVAKDLMEALIKRDEPLPIDPMEVYKRHQSGEDLYSTLQILGSYELHQRAEEKRRTVNQ